ncbi:hypothetical protein BH24ACT3_BH24ACT3_07960 [soil metagenome]
MLAIIDALELDRPVAAGHSKGGAALLLAEQRRPGTFRALYCYEPVVFPPEATPMGGTEDSPLAAGAERRRERFESFEAALANYASKPPFDQLHPDALRAYVEGGFAEEPDGTVRLKCRPADEAQVYRMGSRHGAFADLPAVRCPVTVARGAVGPGGPAAFAAAMVDVLPNGRLECHDDLGHFGPLEDPVAIAAAIQRVADGG